MSPEVARSGHSMREVWSPLWGKADIGRAGPACVCPAFSQAATNKGTRLS
jgi:hypothetical protein